ncbi:hypothetical protein [Luteibaculum oceani]|uniref:VWA domain-containing protein n=1 Tax=Luteibaculum oceani TaxID=1294296 RepID=A0A5C6UYG2_9FLAO|nr:hypothetical protein [Luteibaculum oceani]TXC77096.1 hypothetical protein FRX97_09540 [Luteibaculum oceani]
MIQFLLSPWWIIPILVASFLLARWFYKHRGYQKITALLVGLRFFSLAILATLLLKPIIEYVDSSTKKPILTVLFDYSKSIFNAVDSNKVSSDYELFSSQLQNQLGEDYQLEFFYFGEGVSSKTSGFNNNQSNISGAISRVNDLYDQKLQAATILITDGIVNQGNVLEYIPTGPKAIHVIAVGDTTSIADLTIADVRINGRTYTNNLFPIKVKWTKENLGDTPFTIGLYSGKELLKEQQVNAASNAGFITFYHSEKIPGNYLYQVVLNAPKTEEQQVANNQKYFSVRVIEKEKTVGLVYDRPTPDVGAFAQSLKKLADYETKIVSLDELNQSQLNKWDALVFFSSKGIPETRLKPIKDFYDAGKGVGLFIRDANQAATLSKLGFPSVQLETTLQENLVYAKPNDDYQGLDIRPTWKNFQDIHPLKIKLGTPKLASGYQHIFSQKIGSLDTDLPLLSSHQIGNKKLLVSLAWDWWKLRMSFYRSFESHEDFDVTINQLVQFLANRSEREQLQINIPDQFYSDARQTVTAEVLNNSGAPVNNAVLLFEFSKQGEELFKMEFIPTGVNYKLNLSGLSPGKYQYTATTTVEGKKLSKTGGFIVLPNDREIQDLRARHKELRKFAQKAGGEFFPIEEGAKLIARLKDQPAPKIYQAQINRSEIVKWKPICILICLLLGVEWFLRKLKGNI